MSGWFTSDTAPDIRVARRVIRAGSSLQTAPCSDRSTRARMIDSARSRRSNAVLPDECETDSQSPRPIVVTCPNGS